VIPVVSIIIFCFNYFYDFKSFKMSYLSNGFNFITDLLFCFFIT
jgi:hypothetical protein